jgi:uncharacterized repeat protein (TIGR03803 family)
MSVFALPPLLRACRPAVTPAVLGLTALLFGGPGLHAQTYTDLHNFGGMVSLSGGGTGPDGQGPGSAGVAVDASGNAYGTTEAGGAVGGGMIWEITASGTYEDVHDFGTTANDGTYPGGYAGPTVDVNGNVYGTTELGGANGAGIVWEVTSAGVYKHLHYFGGTVARVGGTSGPDGFEPVGSVSVDPAGDVFGTTFWGGDSAAAFDGDGMAFEITASGAYLDLHDFGGTTTNADGQSGPDGRLPGAAPTFDLQGDLFGTTTLGGAADQGVIWELTASGTYKDRWDFADNSTDAFGDEPRAPLTVDSAGDLFGTTALGSYVVGGPGGDGQVWELTSSGTFVNLHEFAEPITNADGDSGLDGGQPENGVHFDGAGNMFGTASYGGAYDDGMVWEITHAGVYKDLHDFWGPTVSGTDGAVPTCIVAIDGAGNLYGTAGYGANQEGMIWKISGAATPPAASRLAVTAPATATVGVPSAIAVSAWDPYSDPVFTYRGLMHFTSSDPNVALPPTQFMPAGGSGRFNATLGTAGAQTITASDAYVPVILGTSRSIATSPSGASHLVVSAPASATAGQSLTLTVTAKDAFGNTVPTYRGLLRFTSSDAQAGLPPSQFFPAGGVGTFTATLKTSGSQTVGVGDVYLPVMTGTSNAVAVGSNGASHLVVSAPASATAGSSFTFTVTPEDAYGNAVGSYSGLLHFSSTDGAAALPLNQFFPAGGPATFTATFGTSGSQTLTVTDVYLPVVTGTSSLVTVSP